MSLSRTGILLIQLGSPDQPTRTAVARYLRHFLGDRRLIDLPRLIRWLLVHLIIAPFRASRTARAYAKIWTDEGSPLVVYSKRLRDALQQRFGDELVVQLAMTYGSPNNQTSLAQLAQAGVDRLLVVPLYPQSASATTAGSSAALMTELCRSWEFPTLRIASPFYDHDEFLESWAALSRDRLSDFKPDHVLFSFHGMPHRHLLKGNACEATCLAAERCQRADAGRACCYRGQAQKTAEGIAQAIGLEPQRWSISYQSRLGRAKWLGPDTEARLKDLGAQQQRVAVFSPAFTSDCLETLEELGIEGKKTFFEAGGSDFLLLPCLNDDQRWVAGLEQICRQELQGWDIKR